MNKQSDFEQLKQAKTLFNKLITHSKHVFCSLDKVNRTNMNKAKKSFYAKGKFFIKLYNRPFPRLLKNIFHPLTKDIVVPAAKSIFGLGKKRRKLRRRVRRIKFS